MSTSSTRVTALGTWPRITVTSSVEPAAGQGELPATERHQLLLFRGEPTICASTASRGDARSLQIGHGDVVLRPAGLPRQHHQWRAPEPFQLVHVALDRTAASTPPLDPGTLYKLTDAMVASLLEALERAATRRAPADDRCVVASTELLALRIDELLPSAIPIVALGSLDATVLRRVCCHIDDQIAEPIDVGDLAKVAGLSSSHFTRAFKAATGISPKRYVRQRRIQLAEQLLCRSDKRLVDIAYETGFASQSCFTTAFRMLVGASPARFRRAHQL